MRKAIALIGLIGLALACGDAGYEHEELESDAGQLGQVEQAFRGKETPNFQFGTRTGATKQKCDKVTTGQICGIPPAKTLGYCIHEFNTISGPTPFSAAAADRVEAIIEGFDAISDFTLNKISSDCQTLPSLQMDFYPFAVGSSGIGSNDVKDYATTFMTGMVNVIEGPGVAGNYQAWTACQVYLDVVDIFAKGTTATQDNNGLDHAAGHSLMVCLGVGGRSGDGGRASRNLFNPATPALTISQGEACQLQNFTLSDPGQYNESTPACTTD